MSQPQGRFFWKLFTGHVLLLTAVIGACVFLLAGAFDGFYNAELTDHLRTVGEVLHKEYAAALAEGDTPRLARVARDIGATPDSAVRVTFIAPDGSVLGDSQAAADHMDSHAGREEVRQALAHGFGESTRFSATMGKDLKYVALRVGDATNPDGVVRVAMPVGSIVARTQAARRLFWSIALVILLAAVVLALGLARLWSARIARLTATARQLSQGNLAARADERGTDEVALLARSLNQMRDHQATQLATIEGHRRSLEYLLAKLQEGVIAADAAGKVMLMNAAASRLLGMHMQESSAEGLARVAVEAGSFPAEIAQLLAPEAHSGESGVLEREVALERNGGTAHLLARSSDIVLPGPARQSGPATGRLLVLTDVTDLTRTVRMKSDFVANASHELRTPLTAIRTAVDTLVSLEQGEADEEARRSLLEVIDRHSDRLNAIVADLLDLSRIESGSKSYKASQLRLAEIVSGLHARFAERLQVRRLDWRVSIQPNADTVFANIELLMLALDNLVDNAIKYTDEGGWVQISSNRRDGQVIVTVADNGCGIDPQEQERVFERFYQVARARTGAQRGTGLGLAIVRHAVAAMGGKVQLTSALGEGTRIDITLPFADGAR